MEGIIDSLNQVLYGMGVSTPPAYTPGDAVNRDLYTVSQKVGEASNARGNILRDLDAADADLSAAYGLLSPFASTSIDAQSALENVQTQLSNNAAYREKLESYRRDLQTIYDSVLAARDGKAQFELTPETMVKMQVPLENPQLASGADTTGIGGTIGMADLGLIPIAVVIIVAICATAIAGAAVAITSYATAARTKAAQALAEANALAVRLAKSKADQADALRSQAADLRAQGDVTGAQGLETEAAQLDAQAAQIVQRAESTAGAGLTALGGTSIWTILGLAAIGLGAIVILPRILRKKET